MTEIKTIEGDVLFSFDESKTTLAKEIGWYKNLRHADLRGTNLQNADLWRVNLECADLRGADLMGANIEKAHLWGADLENANLKDAVLVGVALSWANLKGANLKDAKLVGADLSLSNLSDAKIEGADFAWANLVGADLSGADIRGADLWGANLERAKNVPELPLACPEKGSFIAWKKVGYNYLVKLEIPADAKRSSATTKKCRCEKALVLDIEDLEDGKHPKGVVNNNYNTCFYEVGEMVYPDWFDEDRWCECSHGIHFFMDRMDAIDYNVF